MNWDRIQTNWNQYKANFRENFNKLTDDDLDKIAGRRDQLLARLQERYGYSRDVAEQKLNDFANKIGGVGAPAAGKQGVTAGSQASGTTTPTPGKKPEKV